MNGPATHHVHGLIDDLPHPLSGMEFGHGGQYRGRAIRQPPGYHLPHCFQCISPCGNFCGGLLNALKFANFHIELAADSGKGTDGEVTHFTTGSCQGRQGYAAPCAQTFDQHPPAFAGHFGTADNPVDRDEHIGAANGPVHEWSARIVAATDLDTGVVSGQQGTGNTVFHGVRVAEEAVRIPQFEGEANCRRHWCQGDPALAESQAETQYFLAVILPLADDAEIRNGPCI